MPRDMGDYSLPDEWDDGEARLWDMMTGSDDWLAGDPQLQELFDKAFFDPDVSPDERNDAYESLVDYMWDEYGIDFDDAFDWEDYRAWYDG